MNICVSCYCIYALTFVSPTFVGGEVEKPLFSQFDDAHKSSLCFTELSVVKQHYVMVAVNEPTSPESQYMLVAKALKHLLHNIKHILHNVKHALADCFSVPVEKKNEN